MIEAKNKLKESGESVDEYVSTDSSWIMYYDLSGYIENVYFSVNFSWYKSHDNPMIEITFTTDCVNEILEILKDYEEFIEIDKLHEY